MKRAALILLVFILCYYSVSAQAKRPNILVIVADDMGYADIGVHGSKDIPTPNIDRLASEGIRFTDAYVSGPYCSPTRAGLLTGRYPQRFGHEFNIGMAVSEHGDVGLPLTERTMADMLREAGYRTGLVGKWHLGFAERYRPMKRGFDEFFGFLGGSHSYVAPTPDMNPIFDGDKVVTEIPYLTDAFADRAVQFIERNKTKPFFLYLAFNAVHTPPHAIEKYLSRFKGIADERRRTYAAMLSAMDDGIGRTMDGLKAANLDNDTLVFFFSDNGGPTIYGGVNGSSNAPLRGSKRTTFEGGIRVPFIVKWKGHLAEGKTYSNPVIQLDILPTVLSAAGVRPASRFDGVDLFPFITGKKKGAPHDALYWRTGAAMAIRRGDWKLLRFTETSTVEDPSLLNELMGTELYNLKTDISETNNLAASNPKRVKELSGKWQTWARTLSKPAWRPIPLRQGGGGGGGK